MFEDKTINNIKKSILSNINLPVAKNEGSVIDSLVSGTSVAHASIYVVLEELLNHAFIKDSFDENLDKRINEFGIVRKEGEKAVGQVLITGTIGTVIEHGMEMTASNRKTYETISQGTIESEEGVKVMIAALELGAASNIIDTDEFELIIPNDNVTKISNVGAITGGIDRETDDEFKTRFFYAQKNRGTSGNVNDYVSWALEIEGVKNVKVIPLWNGNGTVKVVVMGDNNKNVDTRVVQNAQNYINTRKPIGATVTVTTPTVLEISVSATIELMQDANIDDIAKTFKKEVDEYLITSTTEVTYTKVAGILSKIDGVVDYSNLQLNNQTGNIKLSSDQVGSIGNVSFRQGVVN